MGHKNTGLRRREITALRGDCLQMKDGKYYIHVHNGKGGRKRINEIVGSEDDVAFVVDKMQKASMKNKPVTEMSTKMKE